jgi:hypothetical protein
MGGDSCGPCLMALQRVGGSSLNVGGSRESSYDDACVSS